MGYRSEVGVALKKSDFEKLICMVKENESNGSYELLKYADKIVDLDDKIAIHFNWVKWYEGYNSVSFIIDFLHNDADGYGFVEIGEEDTDIKTEYSDGEDGTSFYEDVEVCREVYIPMGEEFTLP